MLAYYLKISFRALLRSKLISSISIIGLAVGMCAALLISLYVKDELSYDRMLPGYENIYRLQVAAIASNTTSRYISVPSDVGLWLRRDYPQIEAVARLIPSDEIISTDNIEYIERVFWADSNIFEIFQFSVIAGSLSSALEGPDGLVIDESIAEKYFPDEDPLGKILQLDGNHPMVVRAVIDELPSNTHLQPSIIASGEAIFSPLAEQDRAPISESFGRKLWSARTYVKLTDGDSPETIESDLPAMLDRHLPRESGTKSSEAYELELLPIADIHLSGPDSNQRAADLRNIYTVAAVAFLIVLAASINFINLSTARSLKRSSEIAIRKIMGAGRKEIALQFLSETFVIVLISMALAILAVFILLLPFNTYLSRTIEFSVFTSPNIFVGLLVTILVTSLLSGIYPSIILGRTSPAHDLRRNNPVTGGQLRYLLSLIQFAILTILVIGAATIYQQVQFSVREGIRQNSDPIIILRTTCEAPIQRALEELPYVIDVSCTGDIAQLGIGSSTGIRLKEDDSRATSLWYSTIDPSYFELYQLELVAGRGFSETRPADRSSENNQWVIPEQIVINESVAQTLGFTRVQDAVGQIMSWNHLFRLPSTFTGLHDAEVVGIVEDFQIGSVRSNRPNAAFFYDPGQNFQASVKIVGQNLSETLEQIDQVWEIHGDGGPIQRQFFDEAIEGMYRTIIRQSELLAIYTCIAVFIAILGLVGLASFIIQKRTKEIGIRKVVGGSRLDIVIRLLWQFSKPVLLSNILAWPVAYYYLNQWLSGFGRHIDLHIWVFLGASFVTISIALTTVFFHVYYASGINPVKALRYE